MANVILIFLFIIIISIYYYYLLIYCLLFSLDGVLHDLCFQFLDNSAIIKFLTSPRMLSGPTGKYDLCKYSLFSYIIKSFVKDILESWNLAALGGFVF